MRKKRKVVGEKGEEIKKEELEGDGGEKKGIKKKKVIECIRMKKGREFEMVFKVIRR